VYVAASPAAKSSSVAASGSSCSRIARSCASASRSCDEHLLASVGLLGHPREGLGRRVVLELRGLEDRARALEPHAGGLARARLGGNGPELDVLQRGERVVARAQPIDQGLERGATLLAPPVRAQPRDVLAPAVQRELGFGEHER
jgi:hypothetical protein